MRWTVMIEQIANNWSENSNQKNTWLWRNEAEKAAISTWGGVIRAGWW